MADQVGSIGGLGSGVPGAPSAPAAVVPGGHPVKIAGGSSKESAPAEGTAASGSPGKAVEQVNSHLQQAGSELRIQADPDTGRVIYKVVDPSTGQVVLQMPSAGVLAMAHSLQDLDKQMGTSGVLMDKKG